MGNLSSCSAAPAATTVRPSALVAIVLLVDGSMLKFRSPIKVLRLLLHYPNHVICPLDSLKPGLHSLSTLLPDQELQLGRHYLLLPFKPHNMQQSTCTTSKQALRHHKAAPEKPLQETQRTHSRQMMFTALEERASRLLPSAKSNVGFAAREQSDVGFDKLNRNGDVRDPDYKLQSGSLSREEHVPEKKLGRRDICEIAQQKENQGLMKRADMGSSKCADLHGSSGVDLRHYVGRRSAASSYGKLYAKSRAGKENRNAGSSIRRNSMKCENVISPSPLCDTPELQRAYRSLLRRSSSWTPRLQPIIERR